MSSHPNVVVSPTGIIHVLGYTPTEGERGVPITVRIHFHPELADAMYVRLVVGHKAVATKVRELPGATYGRWQLDAAAPPFDKDQSASTKVLISVQALNEDNAILDSVTFGEFSYWTSGATSASQAPRDRKIINRQPPWPLQIPPSADVKRRSSTQLPTPSPTSSDHLPLPKQPARRVRLHRRMKPQSLMRTKHSSLAGDHPENLYAQTPILDLVTPLATISVGWNAAELHAGRRLVRFTKVQDGRRLIVSCEPIRQEDYCESDSVISCIYREEVDTCYVTSVDVIYLLERLTNGEFPVEEKNRIRRNLEGLRPTTVSKHKPGFGDFFQHIMEFPDPKPRNIEKDLKVFEWNLLGQALEKILSKYSIYTSPVPELAESTPQSESPPTESPELVALQLSYPTEEPDRNVYLDASPTATKFESLPDDFPFMSSKPDSFSSPVDSNATNSSSSSAFPAFTADIPDAQATERSCAANWPADYKPGDIEMDHYNMINNYEAVDSVGNNAHYVDESTGAFGFGLYDTLAFQTISDDALVTISDQYL